MYMYVQDRNPGHTSFLRMYKTTPCFDVVYFEIKKIIIITWLISFTQR